VREQGTGDRKVLCSQRTVRSCSARYPKACAGLDFLHAVSDLGSKRRDVRGGFQRNGEGTIVAAAVTAAGCESQRKRSHRSGPLAQVQFLYQLEAKFAVDTAKGGGKRSGRGCPDAVTLETAAPRSLARHHRGHATWTPETYQLRWTPEGARMSPRRHGFYVGPLRGDSKDAQGNPVKKTGRYMTVWKRQPDGNWKVGTGCEQRWPARGLLPPEMTRFGAGKAIYVTVVALAGRAFRYYRKVT